MASQKSTEELIAELAQRPVSRSLWPVFPTAPVIIGSITGLLVVGFWGPAHWKLSALTSASLTMPLFALVAALFGLMLCFTFVSPIGHLDQLEGAMICLLAAVAIAALAKTPAKETYQSMACYLFIVAMSSPALISSVWLLRRGASLHPALVGAGAGLLASGVASFLFLLHCPLVPDGSGLHPEAAAISTVCLLGVTCPPVVPRS